MKWTMWDLAGFSTPFDCRHEICDLKRNTSIGFVFTMNLSEGATLRSDVAIVAFELERKWGCPGRGLWLRRTKGGEGPAGCCHQLPPRPRLKEILSCCLVGAMYVSPFSSFCLWSSWTYDQKVFFLLWSYFFGRACVLFLGLLQDSGFSYLWRLAFLVLGFQCVPYLAQW